MSPFVVDASIVLSWCFEDENDAYSNSVLDSLRSTEAVVPSIWPLEVVNALATAERRKRLARNESDIFLQLLFELPIRLDFEAAPAAILAVARRSNLSAYDASYIELASRLALPLATADRQLHAAASRLAVHSFQP